MTESLDRRLKLFTSNVQDIKNDFFWQNAMMKHMAALLYTAQDKSVDNDAIRRGYDMIKENTSLFSMFRGNSALNTAAMLSLAENSEKLLADTLDVYELLKKERFWGSDYLVVAAYQIASNTSEDRFRSAASRMRSFYDGMKEQHPLLTSYDDYIFSAMLGLSDISITDGTERLEQLYRMLKQDFFSGNGVQALAQVLVLANRTTEIVERVLTLRQMLRDLGLKMENQYTLSSLGVLALLPGTADDISRDVAEAFEYLRGQKGFSAWSFSKQELELFSAALTAYEHLDAVRDGILAMNLTTSITNIIIAQQAAMAAAISASAATSAATN